MTCSRLTVFLLALALSGAAASTAHAAESPLAAALKKSAAEPRAQLKLAGRCAMEKGESIRCSVRAQSDRVAGYHYYRGVFDDVSFRTLRVAGRDYMDNGVWDLLEKTFSEPGDKVKKRPQCWISEERLTDDDTESFDIGTISVAEALRDLRTDLRGGTITRSGRTITRVKGGERATLELDPQGRVTGGVIEDRREGRYRLTITYPDAPFTQVTPTPECPDEEPDAGR